MKETLKKAFYVGLGVISLTKDKVEEWGKKLAEEANMSEEEGKKFYEELSEKAREAREKLEKNIDELVQKALKKSGAATKEEFDALAARVAALEAKADECCKSE